MDVVGAIVVLGFVGMIVFYIYVKIGMTKQRANLRTTITQDWPKQFGKPVPEAALDSIIGSMAIIDGYVGVGKEAQGRELLRKEIEKFCSAVGYNEKQIEYGLSILLATCVRSNGTIAMGHDWVVDIISQFMMLYCPDFMNKAMERAMRSY